MSSQPTDSSKLEEILRAFILKHRISCPESIYQTDCIIEDACCLIEDLVKEVGYYDHETKTIGTGKLE